MNYKKYEQLKLKARNPHNKAAVNFSNVINRLPKKVKGYTISQLDKEPAGLIIKYYLLGMVIGELPSDLEDLVKSWNLSISRISKYVHELIEEKMIQSPKNYVKSDAPKVFNNIYFNYRVKVLLKLNKRKEIVKLAKEYIRRGIQYKDENFRCPHCGQFPSEEQIENVVVEFTKDGWISFSLGICRNKKEWKKGNNERVCY